MSGTNTTASNATLANRQVASNGDVVSSPAMYKYVLRQASNETEAGPSEGMARPTEAGMARPTGAAMATEGLLPASAARALETAAAQMFGGLVGGGKGESDGKRERLIRRIGSLEGALF